MKVAKNMDTVFADCTDEELAFDAMFDEDDCLVELVAGVNEAGESNLGPDFDWDSLNEAEEEDVTNPGDAEYQKDGDAAGSEKDAEGTKDIKPEIGGEVGDGKEVSGKEDSAESHADDETKEIDNAIGADDKQQTALESVEADEIIGMIEESVDMMLIEANLEKTLKDAGDAIKKAIENLVKRAKEAFAKLKNTKVGTKIKAILDQANELLTKAKTATADELSKLGAKARKLSDSLKATIESIKDKADMKKYDELFDELDEDLFEPEKVAESAEEGPLEDDDVAEREGEVPATAVETEGCKKEEAEPAVDGDPGDEADEELSEAIIAKIKDKVAAKKAEKDAKSAKEDADDDDIESVAKESTEACDKCGKNPCECEDTEAREGKADVDTDNVEGEKQEVLGAAIDGEAKEDPIADPECPNDGDVRSGETVPDTDNVEGEKQEVIGAALEAAIEETVDMMLIEANVADTAKAAGEAIMNAIRNLVKRAKEAYEKLKNSKAAGKIKAILDQANELLTKAKSATGEELEKLSTKAKELSDKLKEAIVEAKEGLTRVNKDGTINAKFKEVDEAADIAEMIKNAVESIKAKIEKLIADAKEALAKFKDSAFAGKFKDIAAKAEKLLAELKDASAEKLEEISAKAKELSEELKKTVAEAKAKIKKVDEAADATEVVDVEEAVVLEFNLKDSVKNIIAAVKKALNDLIAKAKKALSTATGAAKSKINAIIDKAKNLLHKVGDIDPEAEGARDEVSDVAAMTQEQCDALAALMSGNGMKKDSETLYRAESAENIDDVLSDVDDDADIEAIANGEKVVPDDVQEADDSNDIKPDIENTNEASIAEMVKAAAEAIKKKIEKLIKDAKEALAKFKDSAFAAKFKAIIAKGEKLLGDLKGASAEKLDAISAKAKELSAQLKELVEKAKASVAKKKVSEAVTMDWFTDVTEAVDKKDLEDAVEDVDDEDIELIKNNKLPEASDSEDLEYCYDDDELIDIALNGEPEDAE